VPDRAASHRDLTKAEAARASPVTRLALHAN